MKNRIKNFICILIILFLLPVNSSFVIAENDEAESDRIIVSMGDSYSAGEGIDNFYDYDLPLERKIKSQDWLAHRSQESWGGRLTLPGVDGRMKDKRNEHWFFVAASGAETKDISGKQEKKYRKVKNLIEDYVGVEYLDAQIDVFSKLNKLNKKADYVTLTIGGNDIGFADIITTAVSPHPFLNKGAIADKLSNAWDKFYKKTRDDMRTCYNLISNAAGEQAYIIVAGYPKLVANGSVTPLGALNFDDTEVYLINDSVERFNLEIENLVQSCRAGGMKICFVPVHEGEGSFEGHEAYTNDPYINSVETPKDQDLTYLSVASAYSIHPNSKGAEVYADLVQKKIDELETTGGEPIVRTTSDERDIVLVLDVSGSMAGDPIEETKKASTKFIETVLKEDASIGIVTYDSSASMMSDFSVNEKYLKSIANNINPGGGTNMWSGLKNAEEMLADSDAKKKIIVLMSDGAPNEGVVGDELISYADSLKEDGIYIYTLGFFGNTGSGKSAEQILMEKLASEGCHYEVSDADDLVYFFGDIADQINGQKYIYVRIACPVDVTVVHNNEKLLSRGGKTKTRTSYGSLTFEDPDPEETSENSSDDRVKILRLKDGEKYDIKIEGNGKGKMNYTIGFMDENGEYSDMREFENIKINKKTKIDTKAENASSTIVKVDSDGDGKYDSTLKATKANPKGKEVSYAYVRYIIYAVVLLILFLIIYIKIKKKRKNKAQVSNKPQNINKPNALMAKKYCINCGNAVPAGKNFCTNCGKRVD